MEKILKKIGITALAIRLLATLVSALVIMFQSVLKPLFSGNPSLENMFVIPWGSLLSIAVNGIPFFIFLFVILYGNERQSVSILPEILSVVLLFFLLPIVSPFLVNLSHILSAIGKSTDEIINSSIVQSMTAFFSFLFTFSNACYCLFAGFSICMKLSRKSSESFVRQDYSE